MARPGLRAKKKTGTTMTSKGKRRRSYSQRS
jgi:hypothetical protein